MPNAIIVGATSGIGKALAENLAQQGWTLGITGRRIERLLELKQTLATPTYIQAMDVSQTHQARQQLQQLIHTMGGMDLLVISAGISHQNANWEQEAEIININVMGFAAVAKTGFEYFCKKTSGHLVGISSISAIRGRGENIAYAASKAFASNYLQGLRQKATRMKLNITVTEILPGWVNTPLIRGTNSKRFWIAPVEKAAQQIVHAIKKRKSRAYITKRWQLIAWFLTVIPDSFHRRI